MSADTNRIECTLDGDPRLIAGAGAFAAHAARIAGLSGPDQNDAAAAAVEACHNVSVRARSTSSTASAIKLVVEDFPERVEVTIESLEGARESHEDPTRITFVKSGRLAERRANA